MAALSCICQRALFSVVQMCCWHAAGTVCLPNSPISCRVLAQSALGSMADECCICLGLAGGMPMLHLNCSSPNCRLIASFLSVLLASFSDLHNHLYGFWQQPYCKVPTTSRALLETAPPAVRLWGLYIYYACNLQDYCLCCRPLTCTRMRMRPPDIPLCSVL